jgi:haloalkane dehalogenase
MEVTKPDPSRFERIKDFPYPPNYLDFEKLQMHYIDTGAGECILALHGEPSWSYLYRKFIPVLSDFRFVAPDFIGFGKSDKLVDWKNYSFEFHFRSLENLMTKLDLHDITLVVQDWGGILGLSLLGEYPERFRRVVILNTGLPGGEKFPLALRIWIHMARIHPSLPVGRVLQAGTVKRLPPEILAAYQAPFPDKKHKGGVKAFPLLLPRKKTDAGVDRILKARVALANWTKPALVMFSDRDRMVGYMHDYFHQLIPGLTNSEKITLRNAGHFLQEDCGEEIAQRIHNFLKETQPEVKSRN